MIEPVLVIPEGEARGQNAEVFLDHLLSVIYQCVDYDMCIFAGDVNARMGSMQDCVVDIDTLPTRAIYDMGKNDHGDSFVEFLKESKFCVLNGRLKPEQRPSLETIVK